MTDKEILEVIAEAKEDFILDLHEHSDGRKSCLIGICFPIVMSIRRRVEESVYYGNVVNYIPEFNPHFLGGSLSSGHTAEQCYWWKQGAVEPRIAAFDKLIEVYEEKCIH